MGRESVVVKENQKKEKQVDMGGRRKRIRQREEEGETFGEGGKAIQEAACWPA